MFYAQRVVPHKPKKLPWYGRWSNRLLIFFTFFCILLGIGLAVVGIVMMVLNDILVRDEVKVMLNMTQFNGKLKVGNVLKSLPILNISVGGIVVFLGIFDCVARNQRNKICLVIVSILIFWFLIVQIIACGLWIVMREKFEDNEVRSDLEMQFDQYTGVEVDNTTGWDILHLGFKCCSLNDITSTSNDYTFNVTEWWATRQITLDLVPTSCCSHATEDTYQTFKEISCERTLITHHKQVILAI
ncbi:uncharacterized protein LOC132758834 [Ruditapes philippinarum]|uniref:uncharacterized protein LOC132758834 n=1 Tax=Ruditapes philippinarum TaxID=129788 RepID=UPI00295BA453|nr:uncharacterized protein LOC132758834 [Ruditapes philippinarum]